MKKNARNAELESAEVELESLLQRPSAAGATPPARADGICIGVLERVDESGRAFVGLPDFDLRGIAATSICELRGDQVGSALAVGFQAADPLRPIVLGLMISRGEGSTRSSRELALRVDGQEVVLSAQGSIELRCGEAMIRLEADGRIELRGTYVTSQASATQRIRGGSVQIN
jgi:hypothetical protein